MPQPTTPRGALLAYADHLDAAPPDATWLPPASIAKLIREHAEQYPAALAPPVDDDEPQDLGDGRIHAMREALGDHATHELAPNTLSGIAAKPEVCDRVMRALARACWPDDPSPMEEDSYVAGSTEVTR